jgi:hypothetical protein
MRVRSEIRVKFAAYAVLMTLTVNLASAASKPSCQKLTLEGEVRAGEEWKAAFGEGWVFRVIPIQADPKSGYSGWDLVVDREQGVGFPDALLVATPPYNSMNEREVGTTFGLRAQDVIGWNPRSFRYLIDLEALRESQKLFQVLGARHGMGASVASAREGAAIRRQLKINEKSAAGQFRILDGRLTPGNSDAAPYAIQWALKSQRTKHSGEPGINAANPLGELHWIKFSITLWLPEGWKAPRELSAVRAVCSE